MRNLLTIIVLSLLCLPCMAQFPPAELPGEAADNTATLLLPDGTPAVGAKVIARTFKGWTYGPESKPALTAEKVYTADAQGKVTIDLPFKKPDATVVYSNYALVLMPNCCPTALKLSDFNGTIKLIAEKTVDAKITFNGQPVAGATISLVRIRDTFHFNTPYCGVATPELSFRSGEDGIAHIPMIDTGKSEEITNTNITAIVTATGAQGKDDKATYCAFPISVPISPTVKSIEDIKLKQTVTVTGTILKPDGKPLAGAKAEFFHLPIPTVITDDKGVYRMQIPLGYGDRLFVQVWHPDYAYAMIPIVRDAADPAEVTMRPLITVKGRVVDADTGAPVKAVFNIRMDFTTAPYASLDLSSFSTDAEGTFSIRVPENCILFAENKEYDGSKNKVEKKFTDQETVELKVKKVPG